MRLTLHYRGPLRANGDRDHKHAIRRLFHLQLRKLWQQLPLSECRDLLQAPRPKEYSLLRPRGGFVFAPLVTAEMHVTAELAVVLLRPEPPGQLLTQGGDIDNRLKTLFDALTLPPHKNQLPKVPPGVDEDPFFCVLESDSLVTAVSVRTEQLLEPGVASSDVDATITVRTRVSCLTVGNDVMM